MGDALSKERKERLRGWVSTSLAGLQADGHNAAAQNREAIEVCETILAALDRLEQLERAAGVQGAVCVEHGKLESVDEDGCCPTCGIDSMCYGQRAIDRALEDHEHYAELRQIWTDAVSRLHALAETMPEHTYQELASALEAPPRALGTITLTLPAGVMATWRERRESSRDQAVAALLARAAMLRDGDMPLNARGLDIVLALEAGAKLLEAIGGTDG